MGKEIKKLSHTACEVSVYDATPYERELEEEFKGRISDKTRRNVRPGHIDVSADLKRIRLVENGEVVEEYDVVEVRNGKVDADPLAYEVLGRADGENLEKVEEDELEPVESILEPVYGVRTSDRFL